MKTNLVHKSIHFIRFLNTNRKLLYQEFNKNEELLNVIRKRRIQTFFQPILSLISGDTIGYEILNRPDSTKSFPTTDAFYDYVGDSKHVFMVESFIRNLALKRYHEQVNRLDENEDCFIFLNIHPQVLADPNYKAGTTMNLLAKHNISPKQVVLELTEKKAGINYSQFVKLVEHYREQGFRIAVDDAGSGYNSLQTLLYLNPEFIKIDKSLIRNIETIPEKQYLVELILDFAYKSETKVIAEGIETFSEYTFLQDLGVDMGQGYAIGKPVETLCKGTVPISS
ncbi:EAL domain-containing protein [Oceanobacillus sp. FSL K6-0127]|uniref:EAL domain-containing protein n=1 Tax=Oceanobacillus sp. FSL K6-0127 TaxID=2921420 RepID=UPI0030ED9B90